MYKRAYIFLVLFIACIQFMQAQKSYSIKGIVKEAASGEPVPYATVVIWNTTHKEQQPIPSVISRSPESPPAVIVFRLPSWDISRK